MAPRETSGSLSLAGDEDRETEICSLIVSWKQFQRSFGGNYLDIFVSTCWFWRNNDPLAGLSTAIGFYGTELLLHLNFTNKKDQQNVGPAYSPSNEDNSKYRTCPATVRTIKLGGKAFSMLTMAGHGEKKPTW